MAESGLQVTPELSWQRSCPSTRVLHGEGGWRGRHAVGARTAEDPQGVQQVRDREARVQEPEKIVWYLGLTGRIARKPERLAHSLDLSWPQVSK